MEFFTKFDKLRCWDLKKMEEFGVFQPGDRKRSDWVQEKTDLWRNSESFLLAGCALQIPSCGLKTYEDFTRRKIFAPNAISLAKEVCSKRAQEIQNCAFI
ncbi:hypothetical protein ACROYT_G024270 [Oculina patagonica]